MDLTLDGLRADDRLAQLGLTMEVLCDAVAGGREHKANITPHDTTAARGMGIWNAIHRSLADHLAPMGWRRFESGNYPVMEHPEGKLAIAVLAGNHATGMKELFPVNSNTLKGKRNVLRAIRDNMQLVRPYTHMSSLSDEWGPVPRFTYFLLHYIDRDAEVMRAELSVAIDRLEWNISEWHELIILSEPETPLEQEVYEEQPPDIPITEKPA